MYILTTPNNTFRAVVSITKNGRRTKLQKNFTSREEARLWATKLELEKVKGQSIAYRTTKFKDFFETWVEVVKRNDVRPTTFNNYRQAVKVVNRLFPEARLVDLDDIQMQKVLDEYGKTHSKKTTAELLKKIRTSLRYAYGKGLISTDFASLLKARGKEKGKANKALSLTDMKALQEYCLSHSDNEFNVLIALELSTGLRRGEILGLRPDDFHQDGKYYVLEVRRSISPTSDDTRLKTKHSRRSITIPKKIFDLVTSIPPKESGYIFNWSNFKQADMLRKLLISLNITPTTFHGLRDTHASFLFANNMRLDYVSKRLGHDSILTTEKYYLELMPEKKDEQDDEAMNLLENL